MQCRHFSALAVKVKGSNAKKILSAESERESINFFRKTSRRGQTTASSSISRENPSKLTGSPKRRRSERKTSSVANIYPNFFKKSIRQFRTRTPKHQCSYVAQGSWNPIVHCRLVADPRSDHLTHRQTGSRWVQLLRKTAVSAFQSEPWSSRIRHHPRLEQKNTYCCFFVVWGDVSAFCLSSPRRLIYRGEFVWATAQHVQSSPAGPPHRWAASVDTRSTLRNRVNVTLNHGWGCCFWLWRYLIGF